jgi:hypothetical protein
MEPFHSIPPGSKTEHILSDAGWRLVEVVFKSSVLRLVELDPYLTGWRFDLSSLYPTAHASLASLSPPFSPEEIRRAFSSMKNI